MIADFARYAGRVCVGLAALVLITAFGRAGGALAQTDAEAGFPPSFPPFPTSTTFGEIKLWIAGDTNLDQDKVALTTSQSVFAFVDGAAAAPGEVAAKREVREEVIDAELATSLGGRSATAEISFDCVHSETTVDQVIVYPGNNLGGGDGKAIPAAKWLSANTALDLTDLAQVACARAPNRPRAAPTARVAALRGLTTEAARPVKSSAGAWVQIGAFASDAVAEEKWTALKARLGARAQGLSLRTATATHAGHALRRALVGPFDGRAEAASFCSEVRAVGGECLVR